MKQPRARDHRRAAADQRAATRRPARSSPFSDSDQRLAESLASQAAIALTNRMLINQLEQLFESFINLINSAIDEKSPYTGGHCQRVPQLTMMLAEAVNDTREGPLADFQHEREGPLRAEDRRPAARLRQGHHAGARGRQGDQARDHLRPHPPHRHALRGAEARRSRLGAACGGKPGCRSSCATACAQLDDDRALPARLQHRRRAHDATRTWRACRRIAALPLARHGRARGELPERRRGEEPHHPRRHAHRRRAQDHQPPHRRHHQDARGAALAAST